MSEKFGGLMVKQAVDSWQSRPTMLKTDLKAVRVVARTSILPKNKQTKTFMMFKRLKSIMKMIYRGWAALSQGKSNILPQ